MTPKSAAFTLIMSLSVFWARATHAAPWGAEA
jgi:hypothetical protein